MSSLHGDRQNAFSYVCAHFTSFNPVRTRSVLLDPHGNYQNRPIQWGRLMLLAEQKAGLFDSVDQRARPVFIIGALADVRAGRAAVSRFRKIESALESFTTAEDENQTMSNSARVEKTFSIVLNHDMNGSSCQQQLKGL